MPNPVPYLKQKLRTLFIGQWLLLFLGFATIAAMLLGVKAREVDNLLKQASTVDPAVQWILTHAEAAPQAFSATSDTAMATRLVREIEKAGAIAAATSFHSRDLVFMASYGLTLLVGTAWARKRGLILTKTKGPGTYPCLGRPVLWAVPIAALAALVGVAGDLWEYFICTDMLAGSITEEALEQAQLAYRIKWGGTLTSIVCGPVFGLAAYLAVATNRRRLLASWDTVLQAHRFAMRARFSIIGCGLFAILLLTGPGEDIVRTVATGAFLEERSSPPSQQSLDAPKSSPGQAIAGKPDFARLGWFAVSLVILSSTCWGWARLLLALTLTQSGATPAGNPVEARLRRDLPIYYGAVPLVAAAFSFSVAPLRELRGNIITELVVDVMGPMTLGLLFFILPLGLVAFGATTKAARSNFGPLSWTLSILGGLALLHAISERQELGLLGTVPVVLFAVALLVFGRGDARGLFLLPATLIVGASLHGQVMKALPPVAVLSGFATLVLIAAKRSQSVDALHVARALSSAVLFQLTFTRAKLLSVRLQLLRGLLQWCATLTVLQIAFFAIVWWSPLQFSRSLGSGAILALGLGGWTVAGSLLLFVTQASRFPILAASLFFAIICSGMMDNHEIRGLHAMNPEAAREREATQAHTGNTKAAKLLETKFAEWQSPFEKSSEPNRYCVIVAAEGGGIRAAFWPAVVLSTLQSYSTQFAPHRPDFASHVFAMSGVSGGSVGLSVFEALCAENRQSPAMRSLAAKMCGEDHLASTLGALLYPDFAQRFLPFRVFSDRAEAFELSWERAWESHVNGERDQNRMGRPFLTLWDGIHSSSALSAPPAWLPALFLNSTMVESGKRVICSNIPVQTGAGGTFIDAHDLHAHLRSHGASAGDWQDIPLITAAHTSARFPLVSPPGRLPSGARVVDGGYFENSAAATGLDIFHTVQQARDAFVAKATQAGAPPPKVSLIFILFRYGSAPALTDIPEMNRPGPTAFPSEDAASFPSKNSLNETLSIAGTLLKTRDARGTYSQDAVGGRYFTSGQDIILSFTFAGERIPLSWSLSQHSCNEILRQFPTETQIDALTKPDARADTEDATGSTAIIQANGAAAAFLMKKLYRME